MWNFFKKFFSREKDRALELFGAQMGKVVTGIEELAEFFLSGDEKTRKAHVNSIEQMEQECDVIAKRIHDLVNSVFMTVVPRDDLHRLVERIDNIIDKADEIALMAKNYRFKKFLPEIQESARRIVEMVRILKKMTADLSDSGVSLEATRACARKINEIEKISDKSHGLFIEFLHERIRGNYSSVPGHIFEVLKKLEKQEIPVHEALLIFVQSVNEKCMFLAETREYERLADAIEELTNICYEAAKELVVVKTKSA